MEMLNYFLVSKVEYIEDIIRRVNTARNVPFFRPSELLRFIPDPCSHDEVCGTLTFSQILEIGDNPVECYDDPLTLKYVQRAFWQYTNFRKVIVVDDVYANRCLNYVIRVLRDCLLNRLPFQYYGILVNSFYKNDCAPL